MSSIHITATTPFTTITELRHGQHVKIPGACWSRPLTVGTVYGSEAEDLRVYKHIPEADVEAAAKKNIKERIARWAERDEAYPLEPWVLQAPGVLTADYAGKAAAIAKQEQEFADATELTDGQLVIIEGLKFKVKFVGLQYSDPIAFIRAWDGESPLETFLGEGETFLDEGI